MRSEPWDRPSRIAGVRRALWDYVSEAPGFEDRGDVALAAAMLGWRAEDAHGLPALEFLLSDEVRDLLRAAPALIRTLTTSSGRYEEVSLERPRGTVVWNKTIALRAAQANGQLWVTAPARRDYQTVENRMFTEVLDAVVALGLSLESVSTSTRPESRELVRTRVSDADHVRLHRLLQQIDRQLLTPREVTRVRTGRARLRYEPVVAAYERHEVLIRRPEHHALRESIEQAGLMSATNATLYRLLTLFATIATLREAGWTVRPIELRNGVVQVRARTDDYRELTIFVREVPRALMAGVDADAAEVAVPDLVLNWTDETGHQRWLLMNLTRGTSAVGVLAQKSLATLLHYGEVYGAAIGPTSRPYGLGVVWGSGIDATPTGEVAICTPEHLAWALRALVR